MPKTKIKSLMAPRRVAALMGLAVLISIKLSGVLTAQSVTQGYGSDQTLQRGMIVGIVKKTSNKVEPIDANHTADIFGVVVNPNDSPITISEESRNVFVSTSGHYDVLVSDQEGAIKASDYISASAISGIGMKATENQPYVIGRAIGTFDGKTNILSTVNLSDSKNKQRVVHISRIQVEISIGKNPLSKATDNTPALLSQAGRSIAGRSVSATRLYLSAIIFVVGTIIAGSIMYAGIRGSIISIGRNPLSKRSIYKSMVGVAFTSLVVFLISVIGVYLLLKL